MGDDGDEDEWEDEWEGEWEDEWEDERVWIGVSTASEVVEVYNPSCLSPNVVDEIKQALHGCTCDLKGHFLRTKSTLGLAIETYLKDNPLFSLMHGQSLDHAIELLCRWYADETNPTTTAPDELPKDEPTAQKWVDYFEDSSKAFRSIVIGTVVRTTPPSVKFKLTFEVGNKEYKVIGPRDLMIALFGWNASIYNDTLSVSAKKTYVTNLAYEMIMARDEFLKVFHLVNLAETVGTSDHMPLAKGPGDPSAPPPFPSPFPFSSPQGDNGAPSAS